MNPNLRVDWLDKPVRNNDASSDVMWTKARVFWKEQHLWNLACDEAPAKGTKPWIVYTDRAVQPYMGFVAVKCGSRNEAVTAVHELATGFQTFLRRMWFLPPQISLYPDPGSLPVNDESAA